MRTFANPSGITCATGNASVLGGAFTLAAIIRRTSDNDAHVLISLMASTNHRGGLWVANGGGSGGSLQVVSSGFDTTFGITVPNSVPVLVAVTKAAGDGVTPHGWMYRYDTDAWSDADGVGTVNADGETITSVTIGQHSSDWYFIGDYGIGGVWNSVLPPALLQALPLSLQAWYGSAPRAGWLFDQQAVTQTLVDFTGSGANETARTNTSVSTFSLPVFSYGHEILAPHSVPAAGGSAVDLTAADFSLTAVAVDPAPGPVTVNLAPATVTFSATAVNPVPGSVTVNLTPASLALSAQALSSAPGAVTVALTPAALTLAGVAVDPIPGSVSVALTPATLTMTAVAVNAVPGVVSVALTPAALAFTAEAVTPVVPGDLVTAVLTFTAVALTPTPGPVTVSLTPAVLALAAIALDVGNAIGAGPRITASTPVGRITTSTPTRITISTTGGRL